jgi:hypothetical protein
MGAIPPLGYMAELEPTFVSASLWFSCDLERVRFWPSGAWGARARYDMTSPNLFGSTMPKWTDMSDYVVHFAKPSSKSAYEVMMHILSSKRLRALSTFGFVRDKAPDPTTQMAVCLSETPLHLLGRLSDHRSEFGIVFRKDFILSKGGNPIWYAYKDQPVTAAFQQVVNGAENDPSAPIWKVTPFVDRPGAYGQKTYFYEHEREWRVVGDLSFDTSDVAFLVVPEDSHEAARSFFKAAHEDQVGPNYACPYIDAHWSLDKIEPLLQGLPPLAAQPD